jgi:hypothetical protein
VVSVYVEGGGKLLPGIGLVGIVFPSAVGARNHWISAGKGCALEYLQLLEQ